MRLSTARVSGFPIGEILPAEDSTCYPCRRSTMSPMYPVCTVPPSPRRGEGWGEDLSNERIMTATNALLSVNNIEVVYNRVILVLKGVSLALPLPASVPLLSATAPA